MKSKAKKQALNYRELRKRVVVKELDCETTDDLKALDNFLGQGRALKALTFGINIKSQGYNMYAMGPSGIGKRSLVMSILSEHVNTQPIPPDWCYIHDFSAPLKPIALELPAGTGFVLQKDMKQFVEEIGKNILAVFESDEYSIAMSKINKEFNRKKREVSKKNTNKKLIPKLYKERHKKEKEVQAELSKIAIEPLIHKLDKKYSDLKSVLDFLTAIQKDILLHVNDFIKTDEVTNALYFDYENPLLVNYQVNLLVDNKELKGAPIIFEDNPIYSNLICRIEHVAQQGILTTNFTLIKGGSLHKANGGFLVVESRKIRKHHDAWDALKRALYTKEIKIDSPEDQTDQAKPVSLEPNPIPLNIKVILLGERYAYFSLTDNDPDFNELFKVTVDFDEIIDRNKQNIKLYARLVARRVQSENLKPFDKHAVAGIIEHSSRIAEDNQKLSTHMRTLNNLIFEADYWAGQDQSKTVGIKHVNLALAEQIHRIDRTRELYYEEIYRHFVIIHTKDKVVGQVNALSVIRFGKFSYGHPTRVTAIARMGKGKIVDIQREVKMGGPSYRKGGMIISNFIRSRYNSDESLSLYASFSFEQLYGRLDGDSASVAEVCALLSALSGIPVKQNLSVTGSMDQYGQVQAIGGANEKIEGYFDICHYRKLSGNQGVIIPSVNASTLMLRQDIVDAVKQKKFAVYVINTIDDAITLLTGVPAGVKTRGHYPKNSVNAKVEEKLKEFTRNYFLERTKYKKK